MLYLEQKFNTLMVTTHLILLKKWGVAIILIFSFFFNLKETKAQQFNTDNYLTMSHGTTTVTMTAGGRNSGAILSFALIPNWEFFVQTSLFWENEKELVPQHFNLQGYAKYMFWVNKENDGGGAVFLGFGRSPGYWDETEFLQSHRSIWTAVPITFVLFNKTISWDLMPGALLDWSNTDINEAALGFTYSTRIAVYKIIPKSAIVGEVYGTAGSAYSKPEYKIGFRWEPNNTIVPAISYGRAFDGSSGARLEIGVTIFTPQYLKKPVN
ncbi:hypothetical protein DFQ04_0853 [Algoriphagus boseongensis]|uniref:Uncharacterized protein n=2 Tax=Algoriphagus boseongensis TaxID=1442587 RepID=A0A4R6T8J4_9BACT|nr:hypothetical protein DFQ04_0853 [Algoriphagus boseongensis]